MIVVYCLTNNVTGKRYVGITSRLKRRMIEHKNALNNYPISKSIRKHGWDAFSLTVLDVVDHEHDAFDCEKRHIKLFETMDPSKGYNLTEGGEGNWGYKASTETRQKQRAQKLGKRLGEAHAEKIRKTLIGRPVSHETKLKMSVSQKRTFMEGRVAWCKGKTGIFTPEALVKISRARKNAVWTDEQRKTLSTVTSRRYAAQRDRGEYHVNKGKEFTQEHRQKLSDSAAKTYLLKSPSGEVVSITNMTKFCRSNGIAAPSAMMAVSVGKKPQYLGWTNASV